MVCHSRAANFVLGLSELQMNRDHDYGGACDNQLRVLEHLGVLRVNWAEEARSDVVQRGQARGLKDKALDEWVERQTQTRDQRAPVTSSLLTFPPQKYRRLVDPRDAKADLAARARSYLHANCAQCHVEAGGGNAQMELEFTTALEGMRVVDVKPVHHTFNLPNARLVAPAHPERSVLLYRMSHRGEGHMPPLATSLVDDEAVRVIAEWIQQMPARRD